MPTKTEPATAEKPARNTGDWRGLPRVMLGLAFMAWAVALIGVLAALSDGTHPFTPIYTNVGSDWLLVGIAATTGLALYWLAAIVAALRGILNRGL